MIRSHASKRGEDLLRDVLSEIRTTPGAPQRRLIDEIEMSLDQNCEINFRARIDIAVQEFGIIHHGCLLYKGRRNGNRTKIVYFSGENRTTPFGIYPENGTLLR